MHVAVWVVLAGVVSLAPASAQYKNGVPIGKEVDSRLLMLVFVTPETQRLRRQGGRIP